MPQLPTPRSKEDFVRLTGFRLSSQAPDEDGKSSPKSVGGYENNAYSADQLDKAPNRPDAVGINIDGAEKPSVLMPMKTDHRQSTSSKCPPEQFQVVWRDLSYEVKQSAIKRCLREAAKLFRSDLTSDDHDQKSTHLRPVSIESKATEFNDTNDKYRYESDRVSSGNYIFENLNGYIRSGEITAIIGPSGAGKTSLLNAICGFGTQNYKGSIQLVGGRHKKRMQVSIIPQKDYLLDNLTVYDNLSYSSHILNVNKGFNHEANIDCVVKVLNLTNCVHTLCKNLSGGEYKRVSIAQELLRQPDILVLDEPTSGLDSLNCKRLIKTLRELVESADRGAISPIAIVMTIHQPDIEIYSMFDHIYCLAPGGRVVFDGHPSETLDVVRTKGFVDVDVGKGDKVNPANLLIEIASKGIEEEQSIERLAEYQRQTIGKHLNSLAIDGSSSAFHHDDDSRQNGNYGRARRPSNFFRDKRLNPRNHDNSGLFWYHFSLLTRRAFVGTIRDPMVSVLSLFFYTTVPILMWLIFSKRIGSVQACPKIVREMSIFALLDESKMADASNSIEELITVYEGATMFYMSTYAFSMCCQVLAAMTFPLSMHILLKELRNGWYGMSSFVLAKTVANFPLEVVYPSLSLALTYYLLGMPSSYMQWRMIAIGTVMASVAMICATMGLVFGALFMDDPQAAIFLAMAAALPAGLLSGLIGRINQMPIWLQHLSWTSPYKYSSDMIIMLRYGFGMCQCEPETDIYLKTTVPRLIDVPDQTRPVINYYLSNLRNTQNSDAGTATTIIPNANNYTGAIAPPPVHIPGVNYNYTSDAALENRILEQVNSGQLDIFSVFAKVFSRSFSYGQYVEDCKSVRSYIMTLSGIPPDDWILPMFYALIGQLIIWKIILYFVVRYKIGSRL